MLLRRLLIRSAAVAVTVTAAAGVLSGCTAPVAMEPGPDANNPLCADVSVQLPESLDGKERRQTDAQATGAWGDPAAVLLTCGVEPPGPTTIPCTTVGGVDWIVEDEGDFRFRVTTFGREPAIQLYVDTNADTGVSSSVVLDVLSRTVGQLPITGVCTDIPAP